MNLNEEVKHMNPYFIALYNMDTSSGA